MDLVWVKRHDVWNLILLPPVVIANFLYLFNSTNILYFNIQFYSFLLYIVLDFIFISIIPSCVGDPKSIIYHHILCIIGWCIPFYIHELRILAAASMTVELNTWIKFAKRYCNNDILSKCLEYSFIITWFLLRVMMYPYLFYMNLLIYNKSIQDINNDSNNLSKYININFFTIFITSFLCYLNAKWTYDLITKKSYLGSNVVNNTKRDEESVNKDQKL